MTTVPERQTMTAAVGPLLTIRLPVPPSTNGLYAVVHGRLVLTADGRRYKETAGWATREAMAGAWPFPGPYAVSLWYYLKFDRDVDGSQKVVIDSIFEALGVNDSTIIDLDAHKRSDKANPRVDVLIRQAEEG